ncbi:MAG: hypothetical protein HZB18_06990 [Chloroflexi bacterium]|nr:hypothetical protein [Chloroflexota bacterium]
MSTGKVFAWIFSLVMIFVLVVGCGPQSSPGAPQGEVVVKEIKENDLVTGEIIQTKTFDQCDAASSLDVQVQFSDTTSESSQEELVLSGSVSGEAGVSSVAKVQLQGSIEKHFASSETIGAGHVESINIQVPAYTRQEYTIVWTETRREGTVEYLEDGEAKFADYSYRVGLELASSSARNIDCSLPTETPPPATSIPSPVTESSSLSQGEMLADGCISSQNWKPDSTDQTMLDAVSTDANNCHSMEALGIFADRQGALHIYKRDRRQREALGMYTPIDTNYSIIEFKIFVNSMYIVYPENPVFVTFAVAPAGAPTSARDSARFNLQVQSSGKNPFVLFVLADAGERSGTQLGTQHYEYNRTYAIRFELTGSLMDIYINDLKVSESLSIPDGAKVFYIGYDLPVLAGVDVEITDIRMDDVQK